MRKFLLLVGTLISAITVIANTDTQLPQIYISEINHTPASSLEWIEIHNGSGFDLQLSELKLIENETRHSITHPLLTSIPSQTTVIIANQSENILDINSEQLFDSSWGSLSLDGEALGLEYEGEIFDQIIYPEISSWTEGQTLNRVSLEEFVISDASPLTLYTNGTTQENSTNNTPNQTENISPTSNKPLAIISEFSTDMIELYIKPVSAPLNLKNWQIKNNEKILINFPELIISEGQFITVSTNSQSLNSLAIDANSNNLSLVDNLNETIDYVCWQTSTPSEDYWDGNCLNHRSQITGRLGLFDSNSSSDWTSYPHFTTNQTNSLQNQTPIAEITLNNQELSTKTPISFSGQNSFDPDNDNLTFSWELDNKFITDEIFPTAIALTSGLHKLTLTATDEYGASATSSIYVQISPPVEQNPSSPSPISCPTTSITQSNSAQPASQNANSNPTPQITADPNWTKVKIDSFLANPAGTDTNNEWIQLVNTSDTAIDLTNWQLDDSEGGSKPYTIPSGTINAHATAKFLSSQTRINLNNNGDSVRIFDPLGNLIDEKTYENANEDQILPTINTASTTPTDTTLTPQPTKTKLASTTTTSSKSTNGDLSSAIKITEVFPNPEGADQDQEWIELHNDSDSKVNLGNWEFKNNNKTYPINDKTTIAAQSYIQIPTKDLNLALSNSGATIELLDFNGKPISSVNYSTSKEGQTYSLITDNRQMLFASTATIIPNKTEWLWTKHKTPGTENPSLITLSGALATDSLSSNTLTVLDASDKSHKVEFETTQLNPNQAQAIQASPHQIELEGLMTNSRIFLHKVISLVETPNPVSQASKILKPIILIIIVITLLTLPLASRKIRTELFHLIQDKLANNWLST